MFSKNVSHKWLILFDPIWEKLYLIIVLTCVFLTERSRASCHMLECYFDYILCVCELFTVFVRFWFFCLQTWLTFYALKRWALCDKSGNFLPSLSYVFWLFMAISFPHRFLFYIIEFISLWNKIEIQTGEIFEWKGWQAEFCLMFPKASLNSFYYYFLRKLKNTMKSVGGYVSEDYALM